MRGFTEDGARNKNPQPISWGEDTKAALWDAQVPYSARPGLFLGVTAPDFHAAQLFFRGDGPIFLPVGSRLSKLADLPIALGLSLRVSCTHHVTIAVTRHPRFPSPNQFTDSSLHPHPTSLPS